MNIKSRFLFIVVVIVFSVLLVWPNIATREISVYFMPDLTTEETNAAINNLKEYLKRNYGDRYRWEVAKDKETSEKVVHIYGSFVQAAFLNEMGQRKGVDPERVLLKELWVEENLKAKPFKLGLDLQGGMNLILEGDFDKMKKTLQEKYPPEYIDDLKKKLEEEKDDKKRKELEFKIKQIERSLDFSEDRKKNDMAGAMEIIRSRIDSTGVSEPLIRLQGEDKIEISLPGVSSPRQAKKIIASTAKVEYHLAEPSPMKYTTMANEHISGYRELKSEAQRASYRKDISEKINLPPEYGIYVYWEKRKNEEGMVQLMPTRFIVLENDVALSGDDISSNVYANFYAEQMQHVIEFTLTDEGRVKFADITTNNTGRQLAVVIDEKVRSAPNIREPITGGSAQISGSFTQQEAKDIALIMKEGALPVPIKIVEERSVGPTLGQESIEKGLWAILLGLAGVSIFMIFYYGGAGLIANLALALNLVFIAGIFSLMDFTITLPGLAGIVLTLGMAVDANVIIYERIREEIVRGKPLKTAIETGFERATWTILDSNITTMIAAVVLASRLGAGPIKGFGVTLFVGIITSLFTSLYISKTVFYGIVYGFNLKRFSLGFGKHRKAQNIQAQSGKA